MFTYTYVLTCHIYVTNMTLEFKRLSVILFVRIKNTTNHTFTTKLRTIHICMSIIPATNQNKVFINTYSGSNV